MLVGENKTISFVDAPGATLALSVAGGTQEEDPAVLLRGGPALRDRLTDVAESLARGHRAIRYDQRERGDRSTTVGALVLFGSADIYGATKERFFARSQRQARGVGARGTHRVASRSWYVSCRAMRVLRLLSITELPRESIRTPPFANHPNQIPLRLLRRALRASA